MRASSSSGAHLAAKREAFETQHARIHHTDDFYDGGNLDQGVYDEHERF